MYVWKRFAKNSVQILPLIASGTYAGEWFQMYFLSKYDFVVSVVLTIPIAVVFLGICVRHLVRRVQQSNAQSDDDPTITITFDLSTIGISNPFVGSFAAPIGEDPHSNARPWFDLVTFAVFTLFIVNNWIVSIMFDELLFREIPFHYTHATLFQMYYAVAVLLLAVTPFALGLFLRFKHSEMIFSFVCILLSISVCSHAIFIQFDYKIDSYFKFAVHQSFIFPNLLIIYYLIALYQFVKPQTLSLYRYLFFPVVMRSAINLDSYIFHSLHKEIVFYKDMYLFAASTQIGLVMLLAFLTIFLR
jgi:hypothetical protein